MRTTPYGHRNICIGASMLSRRISLSRKQGSSLPAIARRKTRVNAGVLAIQKLSEKFCEEDGCMGQPPRIKRLDECRCPAASRAEGSAYQRRQLTQVMADEID